MTTPLETFLPLLTNQRKTSTGWQAKCPAHEDNRASLSVKEGDDGRVLLHCHAGCEFGAVVRALNLKESDLMPPSEPRKRIAKTYDYRDENGELLYQVVRFDPKGFSQRRPNGSEWTWSLGDVRRVPYRLPELMKADKRRLCFIVEGEKDADRLWDLGLIATTNAGGASKWRLEYSELLKPFANIVILPDNDAPGREHAAEVAKSTGGRILELPGLPEKQDVSWWLDNGGTKEQLRDLLKKKDDPRQLLTEIKGLVERLERAFA